jgi:hypothetical protein
MDQVGEAVARWFDDTADFAGAGQDIAGVEVAVHQVAASQVESSARRQLRIEVLDEIHALATDRTPRRFHQRVETASGRRP